MPLPPAGFLCVAFFRSAAIRPLFANSVTAHPETTPPTGITTALTRSAAPPPVKSHSPSCSPASPPVLVQTAAPFLQLFLGLSPALQRVDHPFACRPFTPSLQHLPPDLPLRLRRRLACL